MVAKQLCYNCGVNSGLKEKYTHRGLPDDDALVLREAVADIWSAARGLLPPTAFFAVVIIVATLGYIALGWPIFDAFYMVVITVFSVGYSETQPVDTALERIWTVLVIFGGWSAVVVTLGTLTKNITEGELRRTRESIRKIRTMQHLHNHVIICGYGRMGQTLARELHDSATPFVVIDRDEERVAQIKIDGFIGHRGDATDETVLELAGITRAKTLATVLPQDALNVFITLTARNLSREITIIARGEQPSTEKKLMQAGANEVVLPATIGGLRIAQSITQPDVGEMVHRTGGTSALDLHALGVELDELLLPERSSLIDKTIGEAQRLANGELLILGVRRDGSITREASDDFLLRAGDAMIAISRTRRLPAPLAREVERIEIV